MSVVGRDKDVCSSREKYDEEIDQPPGKKCTMLEGQQVSDESLSIGVVITYTWEISIF